MNFCLRIIEFKIGIYKWNEILWTVMTKINTELKFDRHLKDRKYRISSKIQF
jgi:hypothetical protein